MKFYLTKEDLALVGGVMLVFLALFFVTWVLKGTWDVGVLAALSLGVVLAAFLANYRRQMHHFQKRQGEDYRQVEALFSLFFSLKPDAPLPDARRNWAASPDFLKRIVTVLHEESPRLVVEAGSGLSTIVASRSIENLGEGGCLLALEHLEKYASISQRTLRTHGLEAVATITHAPLREYDLHGESWRWYDTEALGDDAPIDVLIVDGPPGDTQPMARYPALPLLYDHLREGAVILLDDAKREEEQAIVERWTEEFEELSVEYYSTEKGTFVLRKEQAPTGSPKPSATPA